MDEREIAYARGWLRAFFDLAGTVRVAQRTVGFEVAEPALRDEALRHLATLGVAASVYPRDRPPPPGHSPRLVIRRRRDVLRFLAAVGSSHPAKREQLDRLAACLARPPRARPPASPDPAEVRRLVADEGLSVAAVSERYGYTHVGMWRFLRRHGIPTRRPGGGPRA